MSDDEINARVAVLEGWSLVEGRYWMRGADQISGDMPPFQYATDWQWCGPLIVKYGLHLYPPCDEEAGWLVECGDEFTEAGTPQRAICLAVIGGSGTPA